MVFITFVIYLLCLLSCICVRVVSHQALTVGDNLLTQTSKNRQIFSYGLTGIYSKCLQPASHAAAL